MDSAIGRHPLGLMGTNLPPKRAGIYHALSAAGALRSAAATHPGEGLRRLDAALRRSNHGGLLIGGGRGL